MSGQQGQLAIPEVSAEDAYALLASHAKALLVDVRTKPEWQFVGVPDLSGLSKSVLLLEWQSYPTMATSPDFAAVLSEELRRRGAEADTPVLFLCRSGARSRSAAAALMQAGWKDCRNISEGFEGDLDAERHRGAQNGWRARGLPWTQS